MAPDLQQSDVHTDNSGQELPTWAASAEVHVPLFLLVGDP